MAASDSAPLRFSSKVQVWQSRTGPGSGELMPFISRVALLLVAAPLPAWGSSATGVLTAYEVPESQGCPNREAFVRALETRGVVMAEAAAIAAPTLEVRIIRNEAGFVAEVTIGTGRNVARPRVLQGDSCAEVALAAELSATLALQTTVAPALMSPQPSPEAVSDGQQERSRHAPPMNTGADQWSAGGLLGLQTTPSPGIGPRLGLTVRYDREPRQGWSYFSVARGELAFAHGAESSAAATVDLSTLMIALEGCFVVYRTSPVDVTLPCLGGEVGAFSASADAGRRRQSPRKPWAVGAAGAGVGVQLALRWHLDLDISGLLPLTPYSFELEDPRQILGNVPRWGLRTRLALRLGF